MGYVTSHKKRVTAAGSNSLLFGLSRIWASPERHLWHYYFHLWSLVQTYGVAQLFVSAVFLCAPISRKGSGSTTSEQQNTTGKLVLDRNRKASSPLWEIKASISIIINWKQNIVSFLSETIATNGIWMIIESRFVANFVDESQAEIEVYDVNRDVRFIYLQLFFVVFRQRSGKRRESWSTCW